MGFEDFEPIFGEAKVECAATGSAPLHPFLFNVYASNPSCLSIHVTDFHSSAWEAVRSVQQLEDMRDSIGIGGSWAEFLDYVVASIKSEDVKLVMGHLESDGAAFAKLVAQKSKGMPLISISLVKLVDSAASEAVANVSLNLFKQFKRMKNLLEQEQERSYQLTKMISVKQEEKESIHSQPELFSKRPRLQKMNSLDKGNVPTNLMSSDTLSISGSQNSPVFVSQVYTHSISDKLAARDLCSSKATNRVAPAFRRAKVRGVRLKDTDNDRDN
ncbi:uncharacterized protein LOC131167019 [Malania oleifera]|uniref:uncharacterized protein LOC131167019 n=1 Tax=Malania oleifera TaxID=397392 RepID=UPI0025AE1F22|nr:uncharacterized protein LOC131167019 [Malania oleifera]